MQIQPLYDSSLHIILDCSGQLVFLSTHHALVVPRLSSYLAFPSFHFHLRLIDLQVNYLIRHCSFVLINCFIIVFITRTSCGH